MKILGIDPGTATTGFAIIEKVGASVRAIDYGAITTPASMEAAHRLIVIADDLKSLIEQHQPRLLVIERLFFAKNQTTAMAVSEARGVVLFIAASYGLPIREITPPQVKQAITGYGNAKKPQVQQMVQQVFQLVKLPKPDDAADALAIAYAGC